MRSAFGFATLTFLMIPTNLHAEKIRQFDEVCIAQEALFCVNYPSQFGNYASTVFAMKFGSDRQSFRDNYNRARAAYYPYAPGEQSGQTLYANCAAFIRGLGDMCVVEIDIAKEMHDAIRESNDAVLAAWLNALDARDGRTTEGVEPDPKGAEK